LLSQQNIEADLSYAYLHLIAARGGFSCTYTHQTPVEQDGYFSYSITVPRYDKLRRPQVNSPRILVVFYLPDEG
jgi:hypothetical protein